MTTIGTMIREARAARGMSQDDLATAIGATQPYIGHLESGRRKPSNPETIRAIASALGLDPDAVFVASGRVPDDLADRLASDLDAVKRARAALDT